MPVATAEEVKFGFIMKFTYKSAVEADAQDGSSRVLVPIIVDLGKMARS